MGIGLTGVAAKRRRMMRVSNLGQKRAYGSAIRKEMERAGRAGELGEIAAPPGLPNVESQIAIPLLIEDTLIGVFSVESDVRREFSEREEILISIVANQAASAIHNALMYRTEGERRRELADAHERLKQLNETLEERVRARTEELQQANRELKAAQAQLIQSAKLAALGDLVAGVAHEINTPLGAVRANADVMGRATAVVSAFLRNEEHAPLSSDPKLGSALQALEEAARTTLIGTERISKIVISLRQFARLDAAARKTVDLHEGLDCTLTLLRHKLKDGIEVIKNYGDLPLIHCFPDRLNQVFMNLLVNAVQATGRGGRITITTSREGNEVFLQFADTGCGISSEDIPRIFDPGFTTKGVGVGMGLGLPISYRIVQEHGGRIEVSSQPGQGSVFTVRLPCISPQGT